MADRHFWKGAVSLIFTFGLLSSGFKSLAQYDTVKVFFDINEHALNNQQLQHFNTQFSRHQWKNALLLFGYADYLGDEKGNDALARNRIVTVKSLLLQKGIDSNLIQLESAVGTVPFQGLRTEDGRQEDRRVDIFIRRDAPKEVVSTKNQTVSMPKLEEQIARLKKNESIALPDLLFYGGTPRLMPESLPVLEDLLTALEKFPDRKFSIEGHICCQYGIEGDGFNYDDELPNLSVARAQKIYQYLINNGIAKEQLSYKGFGSKYPKIHPERTDEDRKLNRRVEIRVVD